MFFMPACLLHCVQKFSRNLLWCTNVTYGNAGVVLGLTARVCMQISKHPLFRLRKYIDSWINKLIKSMNMNCLDETSAF